jgi:hypothetical protein
MLLRNRKYNEFLFKIANLSYNDTPYYNIYFFILTEFKKKNIHDFKKFLEENKKESNKVSKTEEEAIESIINLTDINMVKICIMPSCYGMTAIKFNKQLRLYTKEKNHLEEKLSIIDEKYGNEMINFIRTELLEILKKNGFNLKEYKDNCEMAKPLNDKKGVDLKVAILKNVIKNKILKENVKKEIEGKFYF